MLSILSSKLSLAQYSCSPPSPGKGPLWEAFVFNNLRSKGPQQDRPQANGAAANVREQEYEQGVSDQLLMTWQI